MTINKGKIIAIIGIICTLIIVSGFVIDSNKEQEVIYENNAMEQNDEVLSDVTQDLPITLYVDVKGAVVNPGVYEVDNKTIINDVINLAGGFKSNAYKDNINLSKRVVNEMVIFVYTKSEINKIKDSTKKEETVITEPCKCDTYTVDSCLQENSSIIVPSNSNYNDQNQVEVSKNDVATDKDTNVASLNKKDSLVNINTASKDELMLLPGIKDSKAQAIIEYRNSEKFITTKDITKVSGIGDAAYEKIKDLITV